MIGYGHRFSHDFDFFTLPESGDDLGELVALLPENGFFVLEERYDTLIFELFSVRCSFLSAINHWRITVPYYTRRIYIMGRSLRKSWR